MPDAAADEAAGSPKRASRKAKAWGWAGVGVLVLITSWFGWQGAQNPVRWSDVGFSITSPTEAQATFDVYLYKDKDAVCQRLGLSGEHFNRVVHRARERFRELLESRGFRRGDFLSVLAAVVG